MLLIYVLKLYLCISIYLFYMPVCLSNLFFLHMQHLRCYNLISGLFSLKVLLIYISDLVIPMFINGATKSRIGVTINKYLMKRQY